MLSVKLFDVLLIFVNYVTSFNYWCLYKYNFHIMVSIWMKCYCVQFIRKENIFMSAGHFLLISSVFHSVKTMSGETFWFVEVWKIYCTIKGIIFLILGRISFSAIQPPAGNRADIYYLKLKKVNRVLSRVGLIRKWVCQVGTGTPTIEIKRTQLEPWKVKTPKSRKYVNCYTAILGQKVWFDIK